MSGAQRFTQVDAFTDRPFSGNPAAVCLLSCGREASWMQQVALEMNLAETAFLLPRPSGFDLRWFTPAVEVDLCGHATLASAHALWEEGHLPPSEAGVFHTRSGQLTATREDDVIWLDFPATPVSRAPAPAGLEEALGSRIEQMGCTKFDYFVELDSDKEVRSLKPDLTMLAGLAVRGVIVTARSDDGQHDFVSRFFAPQSGVPEDPVTGSAHCALGPYWEARLGKRKLSGYQASARGGTVLVRVDGERVHLGGQAVTVVRGEILH
ncbi:MAG TPA: PhzF family phenazine biosynthesis protein [Gemmatimonadales bacterium]|nr:PhzF family phenazine biosynthesis protein [Gemmatimonadales bacterium]